MCLIASSPAICKEQATTGNNEIEKDASNIVRTGSLEEVPGSFSQLLDINPGRYFGERGRYFMDAGELDKALNDFDKAVEFNPDTWLTYRASLKSKMGATADADKDYSNLIDIRTAALISKVVNPRYSSNAKALAHGYWRRSVFYESVGDLAQSLSDLQKATSFDETFLPNLALFAKEHGFHQVYEQSLDKLVKVQPDYYLVKRAQFFEQQGLVDLAIKDFDEAVRVCRPVGPKEGYSPRAWALFARSDFYTHTKNLQKAAADGKAAKSLERKQRFVGGFSAWPQ
jgi:tetratricopeptide (TPR) repeat protein